jgi:drug/metabolite transporter (DMT)-like permease
VFAIAIAWIWLGEVPGARSLIGGAIALAGVAMVHWRKSATTIARQTPEVCPDASTS